MTAPMHSDVHAASARTRRVALVVGDPSTGRAEAVLEIAEALRQLGMTADVWGYARDGRLRRRCRQTGWLWHGLPAALMDGSADSRCYFERLLAGLMRARPDIVVGIGAQAGTACGLLWRTVGASLGMWYQSDTRLEPLSARALRLAVAWTPHICAATDESACRLIEMFGVSAEAVTVLNSAAGPAGALAARAAALDRACEPRSPAAGFEPRLIVRAVFQHVIEQEEQAASLASHLRTSGVRRLAVYGYGPTARLLIAACRRRRMRVIGVVPLADRGNDLDVRRMPLGDAFKRGVRVVAIASRQGATAVAGRVRQAARACGTTVTVVAAGHPGFVVGPEPRGDRTPVQRVLTARRRREIDRHVRPLVAALCRDRVRACCIYGASDVGRAILRLVRRHRNIRVPFFVDGDDAKWGEVVDGVEIVSLAHAVSTGPHIFAIGSIANAAIMSAAIAAAHPASAPRVYVPPCDGSGRRPRDIGFGRAGEHAEQVERETASRTPVGEIGFSMNARSQFCVRISSTNTSSPSLIVNGQRTRRTSLTYLV